MLTGSKPLHWGAFPKSQPMTELRHRVGRLASGADLHLERAYGTALSQKPGLPWPESHFPGKMMSVLLNPGAGGILRDQSPFMVPGRTPRSKERGQIYNFENLISGRTLLTLIYAFY